MVLEEDKFWEAFHQDVEKAWKIPQCDFHINKKSFERGDMVLLYEDKYLKRLGKLQMH